MQGYLTIVLIICHALTLILSDSIIEDANGNSDANTNLNHRKLPIFPKNNVKFVFSPAPFNKIVSSHKPKVQNMAKTLMPHFIPKFKEESFSTTQLPRRKPLMKLRTFTIKSRTNGRFDEFKRESLNKTDNRRTDIMSSTKPVTKFNEDRVTQVYLTEESNIGKNLKYTKRTKTISPSDSSEPTQKSVDADNLMREEDRNEFIFLQRVTSQIYDDAMENVSQEITVDDDTETTTDFKVTEKIARVKRNKNIIEEENIASTISSLKKYTGRDTRLNNNFYFNNINS